MQWERKLTHISTPSLALTKAEPQLGWGDGAQTKPLVSLGETEEKKQGRLLCPACPRSQTGLCLQTPSIEEWFLPHPLNMCVFNKEVGWGGGNSGLLKATAERTSVKIIKQGCSYGNPRLERRLPSFVSAGFQMAGQSSPFSQGLWDELIEQGTDDYAVKWIIN